MIQNQLMQRALLVTTLPNASAQLMPLVILALLLDSAVIVIWYYLGVLLNNSTVKGSAMGEFYQFIGTVIMIGIIIGSLSMLSSIFYSTMGLTNLMSPSTISNLCTQIQSSSQLDIIGKTNSLLSGPTTGTSMFTGLCSLVASGGQSSLTQQLDYPLAAVAVVMANVTNQTAANLNYSFTIDSYLGFLSQLSPTIGLCFDPAEQGVPCLAPIPADPPAFLLNLAFTPYYGYGLLLDNLGTVNTILNLAVSSFIIQMLLVTMFLYAWPYILFGGFVLRSTLFTRRLGGLLIAVAIVGLMVYPAVFSFEYLALGKGLQAGTGTGSPNGINSTYGFNTITSLPGASSTFPQSNALVGTSMPGNYVVNFFVEPNIKGISTYYGCWPNIAGHSTGLGLAEGSDVVQLLLPLSGLLSALQYLSDFSLGSSAPSFPLVAACTPASALSTFFAMMNTYGIIGLDAFVLPLINIAIAVTSISGLSGLFGGDTSLAGLSKIL